MKRIIITIESSIRLGLAVRNNIYNLINCTEEELKEFSIELEGVSKQCITSKETIQYRKLQIMVTGSKALIHEVHKLVIHESIDKCDYPSKITEKTEDVYEKMEDAPLLFYGITKDYLG